MKTDARDSEILARLLMTGFLRPVWVPPLSDRTIRSLVEFRYILVTLHAGMVHRAKACLREHRIDYPEGLNRGRGRHSFETLWQVAWPDPNLVTYANALVALAKSIRQEVDCIDTTLEGWASTQSQVALLQPFLAWAAC